MSTASCAARTYGSATRAAVALAIVNSEVALAVPGMAELCRRPVQEPQGTVALQCFQLALPLFRPPPSPCP